VKYFLGLGSNSGDRGKNIEEALTRMGRSGFQVKKKSSLYETEPVGLSCKLWFYNQVVEIVSSLQPEELLLWIKQTEHLMGRIASNSLKPRVIDIDILLAGDKVIRREDLQIPHPRLAQRKFVLIPLSELAPDVVHPVLHEKIHDLLLKSNDRSGVRILKRL